MKQMNLYSVNRGRESASAYHMAGFTQMLSGSLRSTYRKKCNHDIFFHVLMFQSVLSTCCFVFMSQEAVFWHVCWSVTT